MVKISQHAFDQIQFIKYHKKEQNESLNQFKEEKKYELSQYRKTRPIQKNSANTEKLGQYGRVFLYWPSFSILAYNAGWFGHTDTILM